MGVTIREHEELKTKIRHCCAGEALQMAPSQAPISLASMDEDNMTLDQQQCRTALRTGKGFLKKKNGGAAMVRFEKALMLSKGMNDNVQERRAMRGLAASARLQVRLPHQLDSTVMRLSEMYSLKLVLNASNVLPTLIME